jgi:hypothetical protein
MGFVDLIKDSIEEKSSSEVNSDQFAKIGRLGTHLKL